MKLLEEKLEISRKTESQVKNLIKEITNNSLNGNLSLILDLSSEPLSIFLDSREGSSIKEKKIFRDCAAKYEDEFLNDMTVLNVKMPDVLTRVTEFIPEIIEYVQKIISNGYAYCSDGSVYFDTLNFSAKYPYGKLEPWSVGNTQLINEGEGSLSTELGGKKHPNDFALWKKSKEGEPQWDSPWGVGRPGWHIECSAMASSLLGDTLDVHSGGEDLRFPHHDNELAQSEAFFNSNQWVNYFLHSGHLHIEGLKMSKSLKNFITIRKALETHTSRQLRLLFLSQPWYKVMNYSVDGLEFVKAREKTINEFFLVIRNILQEQDKIAEISQHWTQFDTELHNVLLKMQDKVDSSLKDNFDTPNAFNALLDLIHDTNKYIHEYSSSRRVVIA